MRATPASAVLALILATGAARAQTPLDTSFTYQGRLTDNGSTPSAPYDFQFKLFDAASNGNQIGGAQFANDLQVTGGVFTTTLNFGAQFTGSKRWLQIEVRPGAMTGTGGYTALSTRQELTAAPNALFSALPWATGASGISYAGNVGIGTASPQGKFDVAAGDASYFRIDPTFGDLHVNGGNDGNFAIGSEGALTGSFSIISNGLFRFCIRNDTGDVGIGTTAPTAKLEVDAPTSRYCMWGNNTYPAAFDTYGVFGTTSGGPNSAGVYGTSGGSTIGVKGTSVTGPGVFGESFSNVGAYGHVLTTGVGVQGTSEGGTGVAGRTNGANQLGVFGYCEGANSVAVRGISLAGDGVYGTSNAPGRSGIVGFSNQAAGNGGYFLNSGGGVALRADGLCQVKTLQILGGSDLAESFDVAASADQQVIPGMVVVIDPAHPGNLRLTDRPYDVKVAGVISGANGLTPGMIMKAQDQEHADGQYPIAMTGRVWVWCDATTVSISPGDRLTTSEIPGHAMRADDAASAPGAVIGKAMTELKEGKGLVMVLVNLQ